MCSQASRGTIRRSAIVPLNKPHSSSGTPVFLPVSQPRIEVQLKMVFTVLFCENCHSRNFETTQLDFCFLTYPPLQSPRINVARSASQLALASFLQAQFVDIIISGQGAVALFPKG